MRLALSWNGYGNETSTHLEWVWDMRRLLQFLPLPQNILESRLSHEGAIGQAQQLLSQMTAMAAGCDHITLEMLRLRALAPVSQREYVIRDVPLPPSVIA